MIAVMINGYLNRRIDDDPRLSKSQREAMEKTARKDGAAKMLGLDQKMRPVLEARLDGPGKTRWAVQRNGDPAKPDLPIAEHWPR